MQKNVLRKRFIKKRLALSDRFISEKSMEIQCRLLNLQIYQSARNVAVYSDFKGEVRTNLIIKQGLDEGKNILLPRLLEDDFSMEFCSFLSEEELENNAGGFREPNPEVGKKFEISAIDLFVVPGVAFDLNGRRLGLGKGYYDRALKEVKRDSIVALAYEFQVLQEVPSCDHDVAAGWILTEERCLQVSNS